MEPQSPGNLPVWAGGNITKNNIPGIRKRILKEVPRINLEKPVRLDFQISLHFPFGQTYLFHSVIIIHSHSGSRNTE